MVERGGAKNPFAKDVLFENGAVRVNLLSSLPAVPSDREDEYPLHLLSNSTEKSQSSQWAIEQEGEITATLHPEAARGLADGARAKISSEIGSLIVRVSLDPGQRRDVVVVPKGGHFDRGWAVNSLIAARETDFGQGAAYLNCRVKIEQL
jgi:anaerobic selenocysteine-containing dehydrogenase